MGKILHDLSRIKIPDREAHNSRLFIDLCENIHIHYRELRIVFSLDEYYEFVDVVNKSTQDVNNYLAQNPDYMEQEYPTTVMVAGGKDRQRKILENSPQPNQSTYFANDFAIELQDESVVDEIHVHWRDYRFAMSREHFNIIADSFTDAKKELATFEEGYKYERKSHRDRTMEDFAKEREKYDDYDTPLMGEVDVALSDIKTRFTDIDKEFKPDENAIELVQNMYKNGQKLSPILLSTEKNGDHCIIDGNHRYLAAKNAGLDKVNCVIADITFEQSHDLRRAEGLLKSFDRQTGYRFNTSAFNRDYAAHKLNKYYKNHYYRLLNPTLKSKIRSKIINIRDAKRRLRRRIKRAFAS